MLVAETVARFGYDPTALRPQSRAAIVFECPTCGKHVETPRNKFHQARQCRSCAIKASPMRETRRKQWEGEYGQRLRELRQTPDFRERMREVNVGKTLSVEHKEKLSVAHLGKPAWNKGKTTGLTPWNKGLPLAEHVKQAISDAKTGCVPWNKGVPMAPAARGKLSQSLLGNTPWNKGLTGLPGREWTDEQKAQLSLLKRGNKGRLGQPHTEETKAKLRDSSSRLIMEGKIGYKPGVRHEYLDSRGCMWHFRSGWELKAAKWLDAHSVVWLYEPVKVLLTDGRGYIPDFWIESHQLFVEIKGRGRNLDKCELARNQGYRIVIVGDVTTRSGDADLQAALLPQNGNEQSRTVAGAKGES